MAWTKERLGELLAPLPAAFLDAALGSAGITLLKEVTGEVRSTRSTDVLYFIAGVCFRSGKRRPSS